MLVIGQYWPQQVVGQILSSGGDHFISEEGERDLMSGKHF